MTDRLQMNLMFDVVAFGILRTQKFPARRQVVKKRAHFDLRAWGFTAVPHNVDLAAINDNFCPGNRTRFTRSQAESRHTGDTWKRFAAKPERCNSLKIGSRANIPGAIPLHRQQPLPPSPAAAPIPHTNNPHPTP